MDITLRVEPVLFALLLARSGFFSGAGAGLFSFARPVEYVPEAETKRTLQQDMQRDRNRPGQARDSHCRATIGKRSVLLASMASIAAPQVP